MVVALVVAFAAIVLCQLDTAAFDMVDDLSGWTGLSIAAIAGGGGALSLLAVFWRPTTE